MKIAIATDFKSTSVNNYVKNIIKELEKLRRNKIRMYNYKIILINFDYKTKSINLFRKLHNSIINLTNIAKINKLLKLRKIHILHMPCLAGAETPPWSILFFKELQDALVITLHGAASLAIPHFFKKIVLVKTNMQVFKWKIFKNKFKIMITVSYSEKKNIAKNLKILPENIKVIYHGVNLFDNINTKEMPKHKINYPFIFHLSEYRPKKNIEGIIKGFAIAKEKYKIKEKLIIGGKQPNHLKVLAKKLKVENEVIFVGFIPDDELPLFYNAAEAFIFPSFHESFGMPVLEAMACGCPVITSNLFSLPEVAEKAAIYVNPYDPEEIAKAIYEIVTNKKRKKKLSKWGRERAKKLTWSKCAEKHLKVYRESYKPSKLI